MPAIVLENTNHSGRGRQTWAINVASVGTLLPAAVEIFQRGLNQAVALMQALEKDSNIG